MTLSAISYKGPNPTNEDEIAEIFSFKNSSA